MTLTLPYNEIQYVSDGVIDTYSFSTFAIQNLTQLVVNIYNAAGTLVNPALYPYDANITDPTSDLPRNSIVFSDDVPPENYIIVISRLTEQTQEVSFSTLGGYNSKNLENILSKIVQMIQEEGYKLDHNVPALDPLQTDWLFDRLLTNNALLYIDTINKTIKQTSFPKENVVQATGGMYLRQVLQNGYYIVEYSMDNANWTPILNGGAANYHNNLLGRDVADAHPASAITGVAEHIADTDNPHSVTKTQVGLGNVDNTSDADKPVSTATQTALNAKANLSGATFTDAISATNLSGTNTGDETDTTIKTKLGITTLSGSNTGDQDLSGYALLSGATFSGQISAPNIIAGNTIYGGTISANLDTITKSGLYTCYGTATGVPSADYSWFVLHQNSNVGTTSATQRAVAYDNTTLRVYERVKTTTWGTWVLQGSGGGSGSSLSAGMSLFGLYEELPSAAYVWGDAGKQELNNASTNYSNLVDNITGGLIPSDTIAAWDAAYAANPDNAVPFWGYDSATDKVIVPNIPRGYAMTAAGSDVNNGTVLQNAAPNITGTFGSVRMWSGAITNDCFAGTSSGTTAANNGTSNGIIVTMDASRSNAAYGRDSTTVVRGDQIQMRVLFYVGAEVSPQTASQITAANVLSELHNKLDKPSLWSNDDFATFRKQITSLNWTDKVEFTTYPYTAPNDGVLFVNKSGGQSWTINGIIIHNGGNDASNYEGPSQIPVSKGDTISAQADGGIMTFVPFYGQAGTNNLILGINYYGKFATTGDLDTASASLIETPLGKGRWALVGNDIDGYVRYYTAPLGGSFSEFTWEEGAPDTADGDYVVETYVNGTTWYRKYKSGWVEQGITSNGTGTSTPRQLTLPIAMINNNYFTCVSMANPDINSTVISTRITSKNTNTISVLCVYAAPTTNGYGADEFSIEIKGFSA